MKKGFTLIELMAVIVIISLVVILTFPNIVNQIKKSKDANKESVNSIVISAAKKYVNDNPNDFKEKKDNNYCIDVNTLIDNDYLKEDIINREEIDLQGDFIKVSYGDNYDYEITSKCYNYKEVNYIQSGGHQWINTGFYVTEKTKIELDMALVTASGDQKFFGSYGSGGVCLGTLGGKWRIGANMWGKNEGVATTDRTSIVIEKDNFTFNDITYINNYAISSNNQHPLVVFGIAYNGSIFQRAVIKLYGLKIYDNNILVRDFIPVIDLEGVACLYEKVEEKFYYNQGTGEFLYE